MSVLYVKFELYFSQAKRVPLWIFSCLITLRLVLNILLLIKDAFEANLSAHNNYNHYSNKIHIYIYNNSNINETAFTVYKKKHRWPYAISKLAFGSYYKNNLNKCALASSDPLSILFAAINDLQNTA